MAGAAPNAATELRAGGFGVAVSAVPGSGLLDPGFFWLTELRRQLAANQPGIVVLEFVGNYFPPYRPGVPPASPAYLAAWSQRMQALMSEVISRQMLAYLVIVPRMRGSSEDASSQALDRIYADMARGKASSGVGCIDGRTSLADAAGRYADALLGPHGLEVVRAFDGVHLSPAGDRRFGHAIAAQVVHDEGRRPSVCALDH